MAANEEEVGRALREPALLASLPEPASGLGPAGDDPARGRESQPLPCPFCGDPMRVYLGNIHHVDQGKCLIGKLAWPEEWLHRWNERGGWPSA